MKYIVFLFLLSFGIQAQNFKVYFKTDKSFVQQRFYSALDSAVQLSNNSKIDLEVSCHCDSRADSAYNYALSMRRAEAVQAYLKKKGVKSAIKIYGFGESNPSFKNTPEERFKNRRCDVALDGISEANNFSEIDIENIAPGKLLQLDGLEFVGNQAVPNYYSMPVLYDLLSTMQVHEELEILLKGHVCCGDDMPLSVARAKSVYDFLVLNGISKKRMNYEGYSNSRPRVKEINEETEQQNRRVEMQVLSIGKTVKPEPKKEQPLFDVELRDIVFRDNTTYMNRTAEYNLGLIAEMVGQSNGYLYVVEVYASSQSLAGQRRNTIDAIFRRNNVPRNKYQVRVGKADGQVAGDMLILEVKHTDQ